mmetsp:Transcript_45815/g.146107  ORF Transcript_45815/g.146107 Transcript_45815/m.146107 type:complete len:194 (-) Transcript_45815:296-877(-)
MQILNQVVAKRTLQKSDAGCKDGQSPPAVVDPPAISVAVVAAAAEPDPALGARVGTCRGRRGGRRGSVIVGANATGGAKVLLTSPEASPFGSEAGASTASFVSAGFGGDSTDSESLASARVAHPSSLAPLGRASRRETPDMTPVSSRGEGCSVALRPEDFVRELQRTGNSALARAAALARDLKPAVAKSVARA